MTNPLRLNLRILILAMLIVGWPSRLVAFPREQLIQGIKGPWELAVSLGQQGPGLVFPIEVSDQSVPQKLDKTFPVIGTPLQVRLLQYCPDLAWKTAVAADPNGGPVACITVAGKGAEQQLYLVADIPEQRSMIAAVGGLAIRTIHDPSRAPEILKQMTESKTIGLLTVWPKPDAVPQQFAVKVGDRFEVPGTSCTVDVVEYIPHYSIDRDTKQVTNYSDQPRNPALKIRLTDGQDKHQQWLWSNFSMPPHGASALPMRMEFCDFDAGPAQDRVFIVVSGDSKWLFSADKKNVSVQPVEINRRYPFKDPEYTFTLDTILLRGTLISAWENRSDKLEHPAVVVSVESDRSSIEKVIEINQPGRIKTEYGTLVLLYRQRTQNPAAGNSP